MRKIRYHHQRGNARTSDLFTWANDRERRIRWQAPLAARIVATRCCWSIERATVFCEANGIGGGE